MKLNHGLHLTYCTNVHRGENWQETFAGLEGYTLAVRRQIGGREPFGIGLRLSHQAALELSEPARLTGFQRWLDQHGCYVFTINGFPFGRFHGTRVKEQVFAPDWTTPERLAYTIRLFDILVQLLPAGAEGSVSTLPGSFKEFIREESQVAAIRHNLWSCVEHIAELSQQSGHELHLGLEPEPLGLFENTNETVEFFEAMRTEHGGDVRLDEHLGVNYDTCHFAIQYEEPRDAVRCFKEHGIKISKLHLSSALRVQPTPSTQAALKVFLDDVYLHQAIGRASNGQLCRCKDLDQALVSDAFYQAEEWRVHFHIPLHAPATDYFDNTSSHITGLIELLRDEPELCSHLEIETYTWEVLPPGLKSDGVVTQLTREYEWCLKHLKRYGLANI